MWFAVNLLFESVHKQPTSQDLWEERIVIVQAESEESAQRQGESWAQAEQLDYVSAQGEQVHWLFRGVERVFPIDSGQLAPGTEVFSRFLKGSEVKSILGKFSSETSAVSKSKSA